ncbi:pilus assembly protein TadE [Actinomyces sp. HMSC075C01]|uniref:Pilus assembly protein TadE n=1 Tax=Actinomyces oris TaxID=544580 RepID=A0A1Q8WT26_9ACTO|nr:MULTISPECIES: TadE/TadG family type IV pilus assembly protein [Actinomyces]OFR54852.1 pilus assembly protein TadE [Actinomyces sp. HMSC075C01]OLO54681.1 pilus assembly protein TadE [Actinomyces oris]OLO71144.1 pilus assembly protein TadE [Actinomyces oris]
MRSEHAPRLGVLQRAGRALPRPGRLRPLGQNESGSAVVDFVMVGALVIIVFVALLQVALGVYARNVLTDAAGDGARRAALVGGTEAEARQRVQVLTDAALRRGYVDTVTVSRVSSGDLRLVEVTVTAPFPVLGLLGPGGTLRVTGHAIDESSLTQER